MTYISPLVPTRPVTLQLPLLEPDFLVRAIDDGPDDVGTAETVPISMSLAAELLDLLRDAKDALLTAGWHVRAAPAELALALAVHATLDMVA